jgi:Zn-dependent protease with chaperone function
MDFFKHQDAARRSTRYLVLFYALAVLGVVIAVDFVLAGIYVWGFAELHAPRGATPGLWSQLAAVPRGLYVWGALGALAVILIVSLVHMVKLSSGGDAVARMVGARPVDPGTRDPLERRLINVVEEMAIASGVRVPRVYVMDQESGINAFAAGWDVSNSVVAVTRGTLETLNRDELQGVVAHEFSHIVNGDMRLNIRMMGVLAGIVFIGAVGEFFMRGTSRGSSRHSGGIFASGLALFLIGYFGLFFARLIKAAVSRQREFLADASSVQFTRNPEGIAGALDRIRASTHGALIANRHAEDMSHMLFGQGIRLSLSLAGLLDTHPPLDERIRRVNPRFQPASYRGRRPTDAPSAEGLPLGAAGFAGGATAVPGTEGQRPGDIGYAWGRTTGESVALVGALDGGKLDFAQRLLRALPPGLHERLGQSDGACAAIVALLLAGKDSVMEEQLAAATAAGAGDLAAAARALVPSVRPLGPAFHLPVIDLALPAVKSSTPEAKRGFLAALEAVIYADRRVSLHEFVVLSLVRAQLAPVGRPPLIKYRGLAEVRDEALALLSLIAYAGQRPGPEGERDFAVAFEAGAKEMALAGATAPGRAALKLDGIGAALGKLKSLSPLAKPALVKGLFAAVSVDGTIRIMEAELMRLVGAAVDCPLPPLLDNLDPADLK